MNRKELFAWIQERYEVEPDYPWQDSNAVLRHPNTKKWFGIVMEVRKDRLGLSGEGDADVLNVKCSPLLIGSLRGQPGYFLAYHMNKNSWLSILLDGPEPDEEVKELIELSWDLTAPKPKKNTKAK